MVKPGAGVEVVRGDEPFGGAAHGGERERLRRTRVLAVPEGGHELAGGERRLVAQPPPEPAIGVVGVEAGRGGGVGEREQGRDLRAGRRPGTCGPRRAPRTGRGLHAASPSVGRDGSTPARTARADRSHRRGRARARRGGARAGRASIPRPRTGSTSTPGARGSRRARCRWCARARRRRTSSSITRVNRSSGRASGATRVACAHGRRHQRPRRAPWPRARRLLARRRHRGHGLRVHERSRTRRARRVRRRTGRSGRRRRRRPTATRRPRRRDPCGGRAGARTRTRRGCPRSPSSANATSMAASSCREVVAHVVATEQLVGHGAPAVEELVGQLAAQHHPVGDALAREGLGERVEAAHALGGEEEQRRPVGSLHHEGVAALRAGRGERRDRVGELAVPGERGAGDRRHRLDDAHLRTVTAISG